jgi:hypothetical protein
MKGRRRRGGEAKARESLRVGIIAEDRSDVRVIENILQKLCGSPVVTRHFVGEGCGRIVGKCRAWAEQLWQKGCTQLVLVHDLDTKVLATLEGTLREALNPCPVAQHVIVIPTREIEAWLLADEKAIKNVFKFKKQIKKIVNPEEIVDPKRKLKEIVHVLSDKRLIYLNTIHNEKIAAAANIEALRRCASFAPLYDFFKPQ